MILAHDTPGRYVSPDDLIVLFMFPILVGAFVLYVVEDLFGYPEFIAWVAIGGLFLLATVLVPPSFDVGVAYALKRELGWQIGFQVGRPLTLYWGFWIGLAFLTAYEERDETTETDNT